ncbi:MAG: hypothetical protein NC337_08295 [Roseburia sp.]|nr:hypothetical protein [Roseburia sp.]
MKREKGYGRAARLIGGLAVLTAALCIGCRANRPVQGQTPSAGAELTAYREFLDGAGSVYIEETMREELLSSWEQMDVQPSMLLPDILEGINATLYEWGADQGIGRVEYAYLDCGGDGKQELAVKVSGLTPSDYMNWTMLIVREGDSLFLRQTIEAWARSHTTLYEHGYLAYEGSGGAAYYCLGETFIDAKGALLPVWYADCEWHVRPYAEAFEEMRDKEGYVELQECVCTIGDKEYTVFEEDGEDVSEEQWKRFYALCGLEYGSGCTREEVEARIKERRSALGIPDEWAQERELQWQSLENPQYEDAVREIALLESRAKRHRESASILRDEWTACTGTESDRLWVEERSGLSYDFEIGISCALTDYCGREGIPEVEWTLDKAVSCGDGIFAAVVRSEEPYREICFLINSEAIALGLGEQTEYIVAVDMREAEQGAWGLRYDSQLVWSSYEEQAGWNAVLPYTVTGSADGLYSFDDQGARAMNRYLKEKSARKDAVWQLDTNAVCAIRYGRMAVLRYTCGEQEAVLLLDTLEKTYAVVKGIGE